MIRPEVMDEAEVTETECRFRRQLTDEEHAAVLAYLCGELDLVEP